MAQVPSSIAEVATHESMNANHCNYARGLGTRAKSTPIVAMRGSMSDNVGPGTFLHCGGGNPRTSEC